MRRYKDDPIPDEVLSILKDKVEEVNRIGGLHVQLVTGEPKAFSGLMAYGSFSGVNNYFVMAGKKSDDLDENIGYYGEQLVLLAQTLGLNTCWAGLSYSKIPGTYELGEDEKIGCYIALGYGETQGKGHKIKEFFADYYLYMSDVTFDFSDNNKMIIHQNVAEPWKVFT